MSAPLGPPSIFLLCWLLSGRRYPELGRLRRLPLALVWSALFYTVFLVHAAGHILSSRAARAPLDTLLINAVHWITFYLDQNVTPEQHIGRAAGGPLANGIALLLLARLRRAIPAGRWRRDLLDTLAAFHALIGAVSLLPTPTFDGGALLKWSVYARTGDALQAMRTVQRAGLAASGVLSTLAGLSLLRGRQLAGMGLAASALVAGLEALRRD
ncbi:MAG: hypothetical protein JW910_11850 [Anaerolineae bacterium]|nr:hypothetical protein [Anaerolineae bacterium]